MSKIKKFVGDALAVGAGVTFGIMAVKKRKEIKKAIEEADEAVGGVLESWAKKQAKKLDDYYARRGRKRAKLIQDILDL